MSIYTSVLKFCISPMPFAKTNTLSNCKCFPKFGSFAIYQDPLFILHSFYAFFYQFFQANSSNFAPSGRGLPRMLAWRRKSGAVRKWSTFNAIRWKCSLLWKFHLFVVWIFDYNGNRTEESDEWLTKSICQSRVWLQIELDVTESCYQLIITVTISEKKYT